MSESDLPDPEKVAHELEQLSKRLDGELTDREQGYLQAADRYLRLWKIRNADI